MMLAEKTQKENRKLSNNEMKMFAFFRIERKSGAGERARAVRCGDVH